LARLVRSERQTNTRYQAAFADFLILCRASLNPNLSESAVEEMVIQHFLTERIFRKVFDIGDFMQRNVIAREIENVIEALTSRAFSRDAFVKNLEHFYIAIEQAAETIGDFSEKQRFLNTVYERFFQGFSVKVADTHGIVYTPQPLVDFMAASVEHVLRTEFGASLSHRDVHIFDPFTGTGNFIVNLMRLMPKSSLPHKYHEELHCNELMLLPYYVASMNIEHAFWEATGLYEAFEGICLVDTFETAEKEQRQFGVFNEANAERVRRQLTARIKVIIANPPYNAGQVNENDNNKNRKYEEIDRRVRVTYGADSKATLRRKLSDPYVKAIRYAADRIGDAGVVCYVNNDSFVAEKTFDGMRKHLARDFDAIYVLELGGNVRKNPTLSGTTHNVFGIQVGVSINLFVRLPRGAGAKRRAKIHYHAVPIDWRREQKYDFLNKAGSIAGVKWKRLSPDKNYNWLTNESDRAFAEFIPLGSKEAKALPNGDLSVVFRTYSLGVGTNRDEWVFDFSDEHLAKKVKRLIQNYNAEVTRAEEQQHAEGPIADIDSFVNNDANFVKWTDRLKESLLRGKRLRFDSTIIRAGMYRPFARQFLYFDDLLIHRRYQQHRFFPTESAERENIAICATVSSERPFCCLAVNRIPAKEIVGGFGAPAQVFPLYTYSKDGADRRENIPLGALQRFRKHYRDKGITDEDIFHYVYAMLHQPDYRATYAENLKRELARIPLSGKAADFHAFAAAGQRLVDLHLHYEEQKPYSLKHVENPEARLDWRVDAMKLTKDRNAIRYNDFLTLVGIPPEVFEYRLGNRSALDWVIDQYRVSRDEHGNIVSDPNRSDDEQYIVRLVGRVITVSLETSRIVASLPSLNL
jgi:predicted helicase